MKAGEVSSPPQTLIQASHKYDGNLCCLSWLRRPCVALTKHVHLFPSFKMSSGVPLLSLCASMHFTNLLKRLYANTIFKLYMTHTF